MSMHLNVEKEHYRSAQQCWMPSRILLTPSSICVCSQMYFREPFGALGAAERSRSTHGSLPPSCPVLIYLEDSA